MLDLLIALSILIAMILGIVVCLITFLSLVGPLIKGAPFVPTGRRYVKQMLECAELAPHDKVAELGSGDGRFLIEAAGYGAKGHGFEINPMLVWWSRWRVKRKGLEKQIAIYRQDFWPVDLSPYTVVIVYGRMGIMKQLERKILNECQPGTRVLANTFDLPNTKPQQLWDNMYFYIV